MFSEGLSISSGWNLRDSVPICPQVSSLNRYLREKSEVANHFYITIYINFTKNDRFERILYCPRADTCVDLSERFGRILKIDFHPVGSFLLASQQG